MGLNGKIEQTWVQVLQRGWMGLCAHGGNVLLPINIQSNACRVRLGKRWAIGQKRLSNDVEQLLVYVCTILFCVQRSVKNCFLHDIPSHGVFRIQLGQEGQRYLIEFGHRLFVRLAWFRQHGFGPQVR